MFRLYTIKINKLFLSNNCRFYKTATTNNKKLNVLFFGTDGFASTHLKALIKEKDRHDSCIASIDLVCPPDRKTGRKLLTNTPSETKSIAESSQLDIFYTPPAVTTLDDWKVPTDKSYDVGVVVSFGYFIPPHIISSFKYGAINVHPSLLPQYRGAAPIQHTILYGDLVTGVTIQELDHHEFDAGRILAQTKLSLKNKLPIYSELKENLAWIGSNLLVDTLYNLKDRKKTAITQDVTKVTKAPKVKKSWSELDFINMSAWQAEQLNRAIGEQFPLRTLFQMHHKKHKDRYKEIVVQLLHLYLPDTPSCHLGPDDAPGSFGWDESSKTIHVVFGDGTVVGFSHVKAENKGIISAKDFVNGYKVKGRFGVSLPLDNLVVENNMKKRAKMCKK